MVRIELMAPMLLIITLFGAYANERNMMDVFVAICFGLFGYFLRRHGYPLISLVIGLILGKLAEGSFHQALQISDHDYSVFLLRPLSAAIFAMCLVLVLWPGVKKRLGNGGAEVTVRKDKERQWKRPTSRNCSTPGSPASARRNC